MPPPPPFPRGAVQHLLPLRVKIALPYVNGIGCTWRVLSRRQLAVFLGHLAPVTNVTVYCRRTLGAPAVSVYAGDCAETAITPAYLTRKRRQRKTPAYSDDMDWRDK